MLRLLCALMLVSGVAWGQSSQPSGAASVNGKAISPSSITGTASVAHPSNGSPTAYTNQLITNDTVNGTTNSVQENLRLNITSSGSGSISTGGHIVGLQSEAYDNLTNFQDLLIPIEGVSGNNGGATLNSIYGVLSKLAVNTGTINYYTAYGTNNSSSGAIGVYTTFNCSPFVSNTGTITYNYCLYNTDPNAEIVTAGVTQNSTGQELAPAAASPPYPGRYYWGVNHLAASATVAGLNSTTLWAPYLMPARQTFSHLGVQVTTAAAGATCSVAVYPSFYGFPAGTAAYGPTSVSAAAAGAAETTLGPPYYSLDAGLWWLGVNCSSGGVALQAYVENAAFAIAGASSPGGSDTTPTTAGTAWGTNPAITYISNGAVMPQIWLRR